MLAGGTLSKLVVTLVTRHLAHVYVKTAPARTMVPTVNRLRCVPLTTTLLHVQEQHRRRPSLEELKAQGIYRTPEQIEADERQHKAAAAFLQQELEHR